MDLQRNIYQGGIDEAIIRIEFVLNIIEKLDEDFFNLRINNNICMEEIIGALVSAEQELKEYKKEIC